MMRQVQTTTSATPAAALPNGPAVAPRVPALTSGVPQQTPKAATLAEVLGPPPKIKQPTASMPLTYAQDTGEALEDLTVQTNEGSMAKILAQQSAALTSLVTHFTGGDPISDLSGASSSGGGVNTKGVARRERMQQDLAMGNSTYFLAVLQQIHRKLHPAKPMPKTEAEMIGSGISLTSFLERFGGYWDRPENGMMMWVLAHALDSAIEGNQHMVREYLALAVAALDQANMDSSWSVAYLLSLLEEPPAQVFAARTVAVSALGRPFSPLVPPTWAAVSLAYLKEMDLLQTKKTEAKTGKPVAPKPEPKPGSPGPKRPKFPRRPKNQGDASPSTAA